MFETKYLIIIGVILCLLVLYYFYDEISNIKRTFLPTYQKTMALEAKLLEYEKNHERQYKNKQNITKSKHKLESPIMSITYASSDVRTNPDGTSSIRYANITDLEANELLGALAKNKDNGNTNKAPQGTPVSHETSHKIPHITSQLTSQGTSQSVQLKPQPVLDPQHLDSEVKDMDPTISDTIHVKTSELGLNNSNESDYTNIWKAINNITDFRGNFPSQKVYSSMELDLNVVKSISDSVHQIDLPIEDTYSDIPISKLNQYKSKQKKRSNESQFHKDVKNQRPSVRL